MLKKQHLPCKTCLVVSVCKARLSQLNITIDTAYSIVVNMCYKCPDLETYVKPFDFYYHDLSNRLEAILYLTGVEISQRRRVHDKSAM